MQAERLFISLESHDLGMLRPELESALAGRTEELAELSPRGKLAQIKCPIYLLHGEGDRVIPSSETEWADLELGRRAHVTLVSPLIEHVEVDHPAGLIDKIALVEFVAGLL
jgi:pimeloyl-ACP methyl ester carboxylesterase